jgi:hypothetical protein
MNIQTNPEWRFDGDVPDSDKKALVDLQKRVFSEKSYPLGYKTKTERIKGGGSGAVVYDVAVLDSSQNVVAHFVFKLHQRPEEARSESSRAKKVQGKYFFAQLGETYFSEFPNWVVYEHAGGTSDARTLGDLLKQKDANIPVLTYAFEVFFAGIHEQLKSPEDKHLKEGPEYLASVRSRLIPDLILEAESAEFASGKLIVPTGKRYHPPSNVGTHDVWRLGADQAEDSADWGMCVALTEWSAMSSAWPYLPFRIGERILWLRLKDQSAREKLLKDLPGKESFELIFWSTDARDVRHHLEGLGYRAAAIASQEDLLKFAKETQVITYLRHADLHCENVAYAHGGMIAIDLAALDFESPFICHARLETSIWFDIIQKSRLNAAQFDELLAYIDAPDLKDSSFHFGEIELAVRILRFVRKHAQTLIGNNRLRELDQLILTYAIQVVIYQRRSLKQKDPPTEIWMRYASHWLKKLDSPSSTAGTSPPGHSPGSDAPSVPVTGRDPFPDEVAALAVRLAALEGSTKEVLDMAEDLRALRATSQTEREAAQAYMQTTTDEVRASDVRFDKVEKLLTALGSSIRGLDKKVAEIGAEVTSSKVDLQFLAQRTTALERGIGGQVEADLNLYWNALPRPQWPFSRKRWFLSIALLLSIAYSAVMAYVWAR